VRPLRLALLPLGIAFGLGAEWASYQIGDLALTAADFVVGSSLISCGVVAWDRRPESRVGELMFLAGFTWFLGTLFEPVLFLHRGVLVHLLLSYPTGRLPTRLARVVVVFAYVDAAIEPLARNDWITLALSSVVAFAALWGFLGATGPARKAAGLSLAATLAFVAVLALGGIDRLAGVTAGPVVLWTYDLMIACVVIVLAIDLLRGRWREAVVTGLVVDLGAHDEVGTLRTRLAHALGDPSLVVGYRLPEKGAFVDDAGRRVELPSPGSGRAVTGIDDRGERVAVLVHDDGLLADRKLLESVAAAARIAVSNARLQAEARVQAEELDASRRRIVEAGDAQRRRLEQELRLGAERRLHSVATLLADAQKAAALTDGEVIRALERDLGEASRELREFAQGVHPAALTEGGLMPALALLSERSTIPVDVKGQIGRLPGPVEAAFYFVCSEALANVAKHSAASRASIEVCEENRRVVVEVSDDGVGGASPRRGSGLRGLADRIEALGGTFRIDSPRGSGTLVVVEIPVATSEVV
jgi:signal transduction histidine kinase